MSKQVSLPKISSILQKMKIGQNSIYALFAQSPSISCQLKCWLSVARVSIKCQVLTLFAKSSGKKKSLVYWSLRIVYFTFDWSVYSWLLWWSGHNCKWFCWLYSQNMEIVFWTVPTDQIWTLRLGDKGMLSPSPLLSISCLKGLQNLGRGLLYGKVSSADCPA